MIGNSAGFSLERIAEEHDTNISGFNPQKFGNTIVLGRYSILSITFYRPYLLLVVDIYYKVVISGYLFTNRNQNCWDQNYWMNRIETDRHPFLGMDETKGSKLGDIQHEFLLAVICLSLLSLVVFWEG